MWQVVLPSTACYFLASDPSLETPPHTLTWQRQLKHGLHSPATAKGQFPDVCTNANCCVIACASNRGQKSQCALRVKGPVQEGVAELHRIWVSVSPNTHKKAPRKLGRGSQNKICFLEIKNSLKETSRTTFRDMLELRTG